MERITLPYLRDDWNIRQKHKMPQENGMLQYPQGEGLLTNKPVLWSHQIINKFISSLHKNGLQFVGLKQKGRLNVIYYITIFNILLSVIKN